MKTETDVEHETALRMLAEDIDNETSVPKRALIVPKVEAKEVVETRRTKKSKLWFWFIAAFLVQAAMWTTWLVIASHHRVEEVPLAPSHPAKPAPSPGNHPGGGR
jgi:hypothetical protein